MDASFTKLVGRNRSARGVTYGSADAEKREEQPTVTEVSTQEAQTEGNSAETSEALTRVPSRTPTVARSPTQANEDPVHLSIPGLLLKLLKSPRALSAVFLTLSFGYA